jgi:hypothetical protein
MEAVPAMTFDFTRLKEQRDSVGSTCSWAFVLCATSAMKAQARGCKVFEEKWAEAADEWICIRFMPPAGETPCDGARRQLGP